MGRLRDQSGQVVPVAIGLAALLLLGLVGLTHYGLAHLAAAQAQNAADQAALSAGRAQLAGADPEVAAREVVSGWGAELEELSADETGAVEVLVSVAAPTRLRVRARAHASWGPGGAGPNAGRATGGGYSGPLVLRDSVPLCPAVALAFDRMDRAAQLAGVDLVAVSGFRSDREQAELFRRHPDPRWVAPPGRSRHRDATEIDIASAGGAWGWLAANGARFGFVQRYFWEPWHWGFVAGCAPGAGSTNPPLVQLIPPPDDDVGR